MTGSESGNRPHELTRDGVGQMDVEIFTRDGCKSSRRAKDFLARHGIGFVEPVIRAEGHTIYGFREQALGKLLGIF